MPDSEPPDFDFEQWARLAREDPEGFEARRAETIARVIDKVPDHHRKRLEGLQWRVDLMRQHCKNPMAACLSISDLMWETMVGRNGLLESLRALADLDTDHGACPEGDATVIPFRRDPE